MLDYAFAPSSALAGPHSRPPCAASVERAFALDAPLGGRLAGRLRDSVRWIEREDASPGSSSPLGERLRRPSARRRKRSTTTSLRRKHDRLLSELRLAEQVQRSMLPRFLPKLPQVEFGAALRPSLHLAGDFYNVIRLDGHRVGVCLGDVMGHGPAAALLGVFAMQGIRTKTIEGSSYEILPPAEVVANLSRRPDPGRLPRTGRSSRWSTEMLDATTRGVLHLRLWAAIPPAHVASRARRASSSPGRPAASLLGVFDVPVRGVRDRVSLRPGDRAGPVQRRRGIGPLGRASGRGRGRPGRSRCRPARRPDPAGDRRRRDGDWPGPDEGPLRRS